MMKSMAKSVVNDNNCDEEVINLRSLKQMDAHIDEIVLSCGQCAVYKFSNSSNEWERKEIEGSMFVVHRQIAPNYGFVVINRLNTTNMFQSIDHNFDINITIPYLLYKNSKNEIFCIWFYNENDCKNFSERLQQIIAKLSEVNNHLLQTQSNPNDILKKLFTMDINAEERGLSQRTQLNGQNSRMPIQPTVSAQPQKLSLQVHQLFESHMGAQAMPAIPSEAQTLEDPILSDVITPAMLTNQSSKPKAIPNESLSLVQSQSPIAFSQQSIGVTNTSVYNQTYLPLMVSKDNSKGPSPLTMEQLKQTLIHLLQSDADFLHSIHSAYIQAIKK